MQMREFAAGQVIFLEGDPSEEAYVIRSGRVEILKNAASGAVRLSVLGEGDVFGEMGLLDERPRSATARATEPVVASAISRAEFTRQLLFEPRQALDLLRALFERLRVMNQMLADQGAPMPPRSAGGVPRVFLVPETSETRQVVPEEGIEVTRFPFRVGRRAVDEEGEVLAFNEIQLDDVEPYRVSLNHFSLDLDLEGIVVRDRGSRQGTRVDDIPIGSGTLRDILTLSIGTHEVVAGPMDSPFRFKVVVRPDGGVLQ